MSDKGQMAAMEPLSIIDYVRSADIVDRKAILATQASLAVR